MTNTRHSFTNLLGFSRDTTSHTEKAISGLGGLLGIYTIWLTSSQFLSAQDTPLIVASMGASAVLLFAVPHGKLSQPWNLVAGHIISAIIGVSCAKLINHTGIAAGTAVGLAILAMHYTRSIHPPGGATALMAVIGGPGIHQLGYGYVITPVLINACVILLIAVLFNYPFRWRRYPEGLFRAPSGCGQSDLQTQDLRYALEQADAVATITEQELALLFRLAQKHASDDHLQPRDIHKDHYYSNGRLGGEWSVRHIIDGPDTMEEEDQLVYKVVAGNDKYHTGSTSRLSMAKWSRYEVSPDLDRHHGWKKVTND